LLLRDVIRNSGGTLRLLPVAAHLNRVIPVWRAAALGALSAAIVMALPADASTAPAAVSICAGGSSLGTFQILVRPFSAGAPLPLKSVASIEGGARLIWNPIHLFPAPSHDAQVSAVLVPAAEGDLILTLEPRNAATSTEWQLPERPQVIALIYGPHGLSEGKIKSLVMHNGELLRQLADYAEQSSQVESLVQYLSTAEQSGAGPDAVFQGISTRYGVAPQKLNATPSNQQAALLLQAVLPSTTAYDPLAAQSSQIQQSGGLAAAVAGLFFGNPVALAAGGAALFSNLRLVLFPNTEFRAAFTQAAEKDGLALCAKNQAPKAKTRIAYLWAYRVPEIKKPSLTLAGNAHLPLGSKSTLAVKLGAGSASKDLALAREWRLTPEAGGAAIPVEVQPTAAGGLEIDLAKTKAAAGDYQLSARWDWDTLPVSGVLHLHSYSDLTHVSLAPAERDKLVAGNGAADTPVALSGADFEFLEKVQLESTARKAKPEDVDFTLPKGKRGGPQDSVTVYMDTAKPGAYRLLLAQSDGVAHTVPVTVLPPDPKLTNLPIRLNVKEKREPIHLEGSGLERVESISSDAGEIRGAPGPNGWSGEIVPKAGLAKGRKFSLRLKVEGLANPLVVADAIEMVGPRPGIVSAQKSPAGDLGIELAADELPAGIAAGMVLQIDHLEQAVRPRLELSCQSGEARQTLTLSPSEASHGASLSFAGPGALYLSLDPGVVGYAGCRLQATAILEPEGRSEPFLLGRVVRLPRLDKFTLTAEKVGESNYAGVLEGHDLDVIGKVGWDGESGVPVGAIPTPSPDKPGRQTLRIVMPWPAPAPHAPLYVWLRGEQTGRRTAVTY
jgi:hypothetical protein